MATLLVGASFLTEDPYGRRAGTHPARENLSRAHAQSRRGLHRVAGIPWHRHSMDLVAQEEDSADEKADSPEEDRCRLVVESSSSPGDHKHHHGHV